MQKLRVDTNMERKPAYDEAYLPAAQEILAFMIDTGVYFFNYKPQEFFELFLNSPLSERFGKGDPFVIWGMSGTEIAFEITSEDIDSYREALDQRTFKNQLSPEYWAGWSLAYYQWYSGKSFKEINEKISFSEIIHLYIPYHEMDITQFCDRLDNVFLENEP